MTPSLFRAFAHRNYRLFFTGQSISLIGTWMQYIALNWLVYRLTGSVMLLGVVGFVGQIPTFLLSPLAGVFADRYDRHRILLLTQSLALVQACLLAALVMSGHVRVWHLICLCVAQGLINSFDIPARQAFTNDMVPRREDLSNAIALNSSMVNMAKLVGPSLAGIIIALTDEGVCFLINALSYIAVIVSLLMMTVPVATPRKHTTRVLHEIAQGVRYAARFTPIRDILLLMGLVSFVGVPYQTLMPVFARDVFEGGPQTLGFLMGMAGLGALCGAVFLASRRTVRGLGRTIAAASAVFGAGLVAFACSRVLILSLFLVLVCGMGMMLEMAGSNTILQLIVDEDKRGRVMSFYTMAFMGTVPLGSLFSGFLASHCGVRVTVFIGGVCCLFGAAFFAVRLPYLARQVRPVLAQKGLLVTVP